MNTLLIDFKNTSDSELKLISSKFKINYEYLVSLRDEYMLEKVFMDLEQKQILAYTYSHIEGFHYNDEVFASMKPYKVEVPSEIVLDVDAILEKISEFGIDSLTSDEKDYLDNISKK